MVGVLIGPQPPLGYVAPELANADGATAVTAISTAADIFSLGAPLCVPSLFCSRNKTLA